MRISLYCLLFFYPFYIASVYDFCYNLVNIYNSYDNIVNLCTLNTQAKDGPVKVDSRIIDLLEYCRYVYELSNGLTNVCYGSVLSIWHDYRQQGTDNPEAASLPDMNELKKASQHTDFENLVIDKENSTVYFKDPQLKLDVGAIAKGYAVREISKWAKLPAEIISDTTLLTAKNTAILLIPKHLCPANMWRVFP